MVNKGQQTIQPVGYHRPGSVARVEVVELSALREANGDRPLFFAPQRPQFDLLICLGSGRLTHVVDFERYALTSGDLLWVHAGQVQRWGDLTDAEGLVVLFLPEALTPAAVDRLHETDAWTRHLWRHGTYPEHVLIMVRMLRDLNDVSGVSAEVTVDRAIEVALLRLIEDSPRHRPTQRSALYDRFMRLLDAQGSTHRSVEIFAQMLGCTPKTLTRAVRERSYRSAKQAIDARLILEAKRLLVHRDDEPIRAIATTLGFDDTANFSTFFKRHTSTTPAAWRAAQESTRPAC